MEKQIKYVNSLSTNMKNTMKKYTRDEYYESINDKMSQNKVLTQQEQDIVDSINLAFEHVPPLTAPITVYRGLTREPIDNRTSFISTSLEVETAVNFANDRLKCCILIIHVPAGEKVLPLFPISANEHEKEVLLNSYSKFYLSKHPNIHGYKAYSVSLNSSNFGTEIIKNVSEPEPVLKVSLDDKTIIERVKNIITQEEIEILGIDEAIDSILEQLGIKNISKKLRNEIKFEIS